MKSLFISIPLVLASALAPISAANARGDRHGGGFHHPGGDWSHHGGWHARGDRDWGGAVAAGLLGYLFVRSFWPPVRTYTYYAPVPVYDTYQTGYPYAYQSTWYPMQNAPASSLPPGYAYDAKGRIVKPDGDYARDASGQILHVNMPN